MTLTCSLYHLYQELQNSLDSMSDYAEIRRELSVFRRIEVSTITHLEKFQSVVKLI